MSSYRRVSTSSDDQHQQQSIDQIGVGGLQSTLVSKTTTPSTNNTNTTTGSGTTTTTTNTTIKRRSVTERIQDKIIAGVWVIVAIIIGYWTNIFYVLLNPNESGANVILLQLVAVGVGINTILLLYLIIYLPYYIGLHDTSAYDVYCPKIIPIMTCIGFITILLLIRATWPVWGFLSPLILCIEGFGLLFSLHFIPALPSF